MSFHKTPKYQIPELIAALKQHGLATDTPSQLADSFRIGWMASREAKSPDADRELHLRLLQRGYSEGWSDRKQDRQHGMTPAKLDAAIRDALNLSRR